jgi:MFS family permease
MVSWPLWRSVFIPNITIAFAEGLLVPVLPLYLTAIGAPFWWIGLVLAAEAIGMLVFDLPAGALLRRVDRRLSMLSGLSLMALGALLAAFATDAGVLFLLRFVAGMGGAIWGISRHAVLADSVPLAQRGRVIAAFGGSQRVGSLVGPVVGGALAVSFGFSAPFLLYAAVAFAAIAFVWGAVESAPVAAPGTRPHAAGREAWAKVWAMGWGLLGAAYLGSLLAQSIRAGRRVVIPLFGATVLGLDAQQIGFVVSLAAAVDFALFPVAGYVMDRFGRKAAILPSFTIQALGMAWVPFTGDAVTLALAASLIGLGNGIGSGTIMTLGADLAPKGATGEFLGAWRLVGDGGAMAGPVLVGSLAQAFGLVGATLAVAATGLLAVLTFALGVPETARRQPPP